MQLPGAERWHDPRVTDVRIWHVGALPSPNEVNGVNATIWQVALEQALLGHRVTLLLENSPNDAAQRLAECTGLRLAYVPANKWRYEPRTVQTLLRFEPPQVVHMHATYSLKQAVLARRLTDTKTPYVVTPHGGLNRQNKRVRKSAYVWLVEKSRLCAAAALTAVSEHEEEMLRADVPRYRGLVRCIQNPIDVQTLSRHNWTGNVDAKRLVFLGRFHVVHKGIDILVEIARRLPNAQVHLYGNQESQTKRLFERLKRNLPPNVHFHGPVFGAEKAALLSEASLYIQTSRWEVFGLSIAEAMYLGVPCAISQASDLAEPFRKHDLGFVLPPNVEEAAAQLRDVLSKPHRLSGWSRRAQDYAREHFNAYKVASSYLALYEEVLDRQ